MGGLSAGMGAGMGTLASGTGALSGASLPAVMGRAALGNALTQGAAVALKLQDSFSWTSVAISAASAGIGHGISGALGAEVLPDGQFGPPRPGVFVDLGEAGERYARGAVAGLASNMAVNAMRGGHQTAVQVATDVFGQVLGQGLVDKLSAPVSAPVQTQGVGPYSEMGYVNEMDKASDNYRPAGGSGGYVPDNRSYKLGEMGSGTFGIDLPISDQVRAMAAEARGNRILTQMRDADIDAQAAQEQAALAQQARARSNAAARNNNPNYGHEERHSLATPVRISNVSVGGRIETVPSGDIAGGGFSAGQEQVWVSDRPGTTYGQQMVNVGKFLTDVPLGVAQQIIDNPRESLNYAVNGGIGLAKGVPNLVTEGLSQVGVGTRYLAAGSAELLGLASHGALDREIAQYSDFTGRLIEYHNLAQEGAGFVSGFATPNLLGKTIAGATDIYRTTRSAAVASEAWAAERVERVALTSGGANTIGGTKTADAMHSATASGSEVFHGPGMTRLGSDGASVRVSQNVAPLDGYHDVVVHGGAYDETGAIFYVDGQATHANQVATAILENPSYTAGQPVRLITCWGGCGPAQEVSNILQVPVKGATNIVAVPNKPISQPFIMNGGSWLDFTPW